MCDREEDTTKRDRNGSSRQVIEAEKKRSSDCTEETRNEVAWGYGAV